MSMNRKSIEKPNLGMNCRGINREEVVDRRMRGRRLCTGFSAVRQEVIEPRPKAGMIYEKKGSEHGSQSFTLLFNALSRWRNLSLSTFDQLHATLHCQLICLPGRKAKKNAKLTTAFLPNVNPTQLFLAPLPRSSTASTSRCFLKTSAYLAISSGELNESK